MKKRAHSNLSSEVATAMQVAVETALAALLKQQKPAAPTKPLRKVAQVAKGPPRDRHGFRGVPPPASFDLYGLPETNWLTESETAAVTRLSISTLAAWRQRPNPPLKHAKIRDRRVRYQVGDVREFLASGERPRVGRPRKKDSAPTPRRARRMKADNPTTAQEAP